MTSNNCVLSLIATTSLALLAGPMQGATTIYHETFSGGSMDAPADLDGAMPDITDGNHTWIASQWQENGTTGTIARSTRDDDSAFLPLKPMPGKVYTLTASILPSTGGEGIKSNWFALGFAKTNKTTGSFYSNHTAPWLIWRNPKDSNSPGEVLSWLGVGLDGKVSELSTADSTTFSIVLNTVDAEWTVEWFVNGDLVRSEAYKTNPTINYVGFGRENGATNPIDSFSLTIIP